MRTAFFRVHGRLKDFFPDAPEKEQIFRFFLKPSLKDALESMGIPHVEVGAIVVNGEPGHMDGPLNQSDHVEVFPSAGFRSPDGIPRFVADNHLGKLVKELRMLGLDTRYHITDDVPEIVRISLAGHRILLTRSLRVLKYADLQEGYLVRSEEPSVQLREVIGRYALKPHFHPFARCLVCNGPIVVAEKKDVLDEIPPLTARYYGAFFRCSSCRKVYWKGSHYDRMLEFVKKLD